MANVTPVVQPAVPREEKENAQVEEDNKAKKYVLDFIFLNIILFIYKYFTIFNWPNIEAIITGSKFSSFVFIILFIFVFIILSQLFPSRWHTDQKSGTFLSFFFFS